MRTHTEDFKNKIKELGRQLDSKITFGETELGNEQLNSVSPVVQSSLLKSVMKELDIDSNIDIPVGTIINYKFGVKLDSGDYEYLDFGDYQIYSSEKQEDTSSYNIVAYDKMLNSMVDYTTLKSGHFPMSVRDYINAICDDLNLTFKNKEDTFANYDKIIPSDLYADLGYTYRDVLDELAQVTASNIIINQNNEVEIKYITETDDTIDEEHLKNIDVKFGEKYGPINSIVLTRSGGSDSVYLKDDESIADNGLCEIKIEDNQIMNDNDRSDYLQDILNQLNGTEYYINDFSSTGICYYEVGDRYNVKIGDNNYSCVLFNDNINITQGLEETIHTDLPEQAETDYTKADKTDRKINQTYIIVDKQNQTIESLASNVGQYDERITKTEQTVDGLRQEVQNITNLVRDATGRHSITLTDCAEGSILYFSIKGIVNLLFPANDLYPKEDLYILGTYLVVKDKDGNESKINLPINYLRGLDNIYDEFVIDNTDYVNNVFKTYIIRRIGVRDNGELYILGQEKIEDLEYINIPLKEGENTLTFESFPQVMLSAKYNIKNDLTDQFATKVELRTSITQTKDEIDLEVSKKVDESEFGTKIRQSSEDIQFAWNQVGQNIKLEIIDGKACLCIYDENDNLLMKLFQEGQSFYNGDSELGTNGLIRIDDYEMGQISQSHYGIGNRLKDGEFITWYSQEENMPISEIISFYTENYNGNVRPDWIQGRPFVMVDVPMSVEQIQASMITPFSVYDINSQQGILSPHIRCDENGTTFCQPVSYKKGNLTGTFISSFTYDNIYKIEEMAFINYDGSVLVRALNNQGTQTTLADTSYVNDVVWTAVSSDANFKKNIKDTNKKALEDINKINVKEFNWKDTNKFESIGLIAQELEKIDNSYIEKFTNEETKEEKLGLNLKSLISLCIKGIQEQQEIIDNLNKKIEKLESEVQNGKN